MFITMSLLQNYLFLTCSLKNILQEIYLLNCKPLEIMYFLVICHKHEKIEFTQ